MKLFAQKVTVCQKLQNCEPLNLKRFLEIRTREKHNGGPFDKGLQTKTFCPRQKPTRQSLKMHD